MKVTSRKVKLLFFLIFLFSTLVKMTRNEEFRQKINGREINLLANQFPPLFTYKKQKDGNYTFGGMIYEYMLDAQNYFDLKYKYIIVDETQVSNYGLIQASINYLDQKEVDIVPYLFDQELNNLKHMELSATMWIDPISILQPWPEEENRLHVATRPFQLTLWIAFFCTTAIFILSSTVFVKIQQKYDHETTRRKTIGEAVYRQFEYVLRVITSQEGYLVPYQSSKSFKILVGFWLISMVALINAYTGVMTALLTVPKLEPIVNTLEEAVTQGRLVTLQKDALMSRIILSATEGYEKTIGDQYRQDPTLWTTDAFMAADNVLRRKCVYPTVMSLLNYIVYQDTQSNGRCRMTLSAELKEYNQLLFQMGFPLNSEIAPAFNAFFLRANAAGIIDYYKKEYLPSTGQCRTDFSANNKKARPLALFDLTFPFLIIGVGLSLSIIAFIVEILVNIINERIF